MAGSRRSGAEFNTVGDRGASASVLPFVPASASFLSLSLSVSSLSLSLSLSLGLVASLALHVENVPRAALHPEFMSLFSLLLSSSLSFSS